MFLADGNALAMDTTRLKDTLDVLRGNLPNLERVGVYGYAKDVRNKSVEDLRELRETGLGIVYLGLETGDNDLLKWARKGVTTEENISACKKIRDAGIPLSLTIILGLGGEEHSEQHAVSTAGTLNEIDPEYVGALTLMIPGGTPLHKMVDQGEFTPMKPLAIVSELKILVDNLDLTECIFRTNHASNYLPIGGTLNRDKQAILDVIEGAIASDDESKLRPSYMRGL